MDTFYIVLITLVAYSVISTVAYIITDNKDVAITFGLGIVGLTLCGIVKVARKIRDKFKYHIGKRSVFEEKSTGNKYKCKVEDADDVLCWTVDYKMIKRYAKKSEWADVPDFSKEFIDNSKRNCDNCKHNKECACGYPYDKVKCKHDKWGTVLEFNKFESRYKN